MTSKAFPLKKTVFVFGFSFKNLPKDHQWLNDDVTHLTLHKHIVVITVVVVAVADVVVVDDYFIDVEKIGEILMKIRSRQ